MQRVTSAKYLGLLLDARWGVLSTCLSREQKMWGAWATLQRQFAGLECGVALGLLPRVYAACVPPVASYGCELWGLRAVPRHGALGLAREKLSSGHITILADFGSQEKYSTSRCLVGGQQCTIVPLLAFQDHHTLEQSWGLGFSFSISPCCRGFYFSGS